MDDTAPAVTGISDLGVGANRAPVKLLELEISVVLANGNPGTPLRLLEFWGLPPPDLDKSGVGCEAPHVEAGSS